MPYRRAASRIAATLVIAGAVTGPTLNADEAEELRRDPVVVIHAGSSWPASDDDDDFQPIDEVAIAEELEPESDVLGTAARTARVLEARREKREAVIPGRVILVAR